MEPGDGAFDDPPVDAEAGTVWDAAAGDHRFDAQRSDETAVFVVVVAAVAEQAVGSVAWPSDQAGDRRDLLQQGYQLGDVVAVAAGQRDGEWDAPAIDDEVVLAARTCAVDRAWTAFGPRRAARTWEESITARDQSSFFATRSFFRSTKCSWSHTPASFHAARRRQQVMPDPKPSSCVRRCESASGESSLPGPAGPGQSPGPQPGRVLHGDLESKLLLQHIHAFGACHLFTLLAVDT